MATSKSAPATKAAVNKLAQQHADLEAQHKQILKAIGDHHKAVMKVVKAGKGK